MRMGAGEFDGDDSLGGLGLLGSAAAATHNEADTCLAPAAAHMGAQDSPVLRPGGVRRKRAT